MTHALAWTGMMMGNISNKNKGKPEKTFTSAEAERPHVGSSIGAVLPLCGTAEKIQAT